MTGWPCSASCPFPSDACKKCTNSWASQAGKKTARKNPRIVLEEIREILEDYENQDIK